MARDEAIAEGAMALFGEKYGDEVRVVSMGTATRRRQGRQALFGRAVRRHACRRAPATSACSRIVAESAVAAGVRRIEALTGEAARRHLDEQERRLKAVAAALKVAAGRSAGARRGAGRRARASSRRELAEARKKLALGGGGASRPATPAETVAGVGFIGRAVERRRAEGPEAARR